MPAAPPNVSAPRRLSTLVQRHRALPVAALLLLTLSAVSLLNPAFLSLQNFSDLLVQSAPVIIIACGMTLVILTGEIDISVGSLFGLLAALLGLFASPSHFGLSAPAVVILTLLAGAGVGFFNALLVTVARVPSIIATLGMLTILRGVTELLLHGEWITDLPPSIRFLGTGTLLSIPISLIAAAVVIAAALLLTRRTPLGLRFYAVGGNPDAAAYARISPAHTKVIAFTLTGLLTALAALVAVPQQSVIESGIGAGLELVVVTAALVGGTSIRGGRGGITGTVVAALLLGSIRTSLLFLNLGEMATYWERAIQGAFILAAVLFDHLAAPRTGDHA
jgi:ribose/xylose/arabinose/galactoside ABC-type transport system permease subunit